MGDNDTNSIFVRRDQTLPPPRPGVRHVSMPLTPLIVVADDGLRARVDRRFHWPMIALALCMLPILMIEFWMPDKPFWLWWICFVGAIIIWLAFFIEFVVKIAIAECRFEYAKRNWIDIVIILVPVMRPLRVTAIARTSRIFRLRGLGLKLARYTFSIILGLEITERFLERVGVKHDRRADPRSMTRHQLMAEVHRLRRLSAAWEAWYEQHIEHLEAQGVNLYEADPPRTRAATEEPAAAPEPGCENSDIRSRDEADASDGPRMSHPCESPSPN